MMPGIVLCFVATLLYIRYFYRNLSSNDFPDATQGLEEGKKVKPVKITESYQHSNNHKPIMSSNHNQNNHNHKANDDHIRVQSEEPFVRGATQSLSMPTMIHNPKTKITTIHRSSMMSRIPSLVSNQLPISPVETSSEFDSYSFGNGTHSTLTRNRTMNRNITEGNNEQCFSYNSMEDFCTGNSLRDSILDERRVFRSSDGKCKQINFLCLYN